MINVKVLLLFKVRDGIISWIVSPTGIILLLSRRSANLSSTEPN